MVARWRSEVLDLRETWAIDILVGDLDGDGRDDIVSGSRWYRAPDWEIETIEGVEQAVALADVDGDGALEVIGIRGPDLTADLCWAKRMPDRRWLTHDIGSGDGDWPHGVATLRGDDRGLAIVVAYHGRGSHVPQIWTAPDDPTQPWLKQDLAHIAYSEEIVAIDLDGDGQLEIVAGPWWLEPTDDGWRAHRFADASYDNVSRVRVVDVDGDGRLDVILTEETGDWETRDPGRGRISWFRQPADPRSGVWEEHLIARKKCPHSLDIADIDGDGGLALIVGEHDAFTPVGSAIHAELAILRPTDRSATSWTEEVVDTRFEHFCGARAIDLGGEMAIISHGWFEEPRPLVLWTRL